MTYFMDVLWRRRRRRKTKCFVKYIMSKDEHIKCLISQSLARKLRFSLHCTALENLLFVLQPPTFSSGV